MSGFSQPSVISNSPRIAPSGERREIHDLLKRELKQARKEILVAMYAFTSQDLARALLDARSRRIFRRLFKASPRRTGNSARHPGHRERKI